VRRLKAVKFERRDNCAHERTLGTMGGDNSSVAQGSFYEGFVATGVTSTATDDAIRKNIVFVAWI
jgi:hypothetical protein